MTDGNDEAFGHGSENGHCAGMTKRELIAAMSLQGLIAHPCPVGDRQHRTPEAFAGRSLEYADALIAALNQEKQ